MKKNKKKKDNKKLIIIIIFILIIGGLLFINKNNNNIRSAKDIDTKIDLEDEEINILNNKEVVVDESILIEEEGVYTLTGNINGSVVVNTEGNVKLILDNVNITSIDKPAILIEQAKNTIIYIQDNTHNVLIDQKEYNVSDDTINSVIYSKDDLIIDGLGSMEIKANHEDGIVSKDDLKIINGDIIITAKDDGIRGKDSVHIVDSNIKINSKGDAIKATNDTNLEKGYVLIENGIFNIETRRDAIVAKNKLIIKNGDFNIITTGKINKDNTISAKGLKSGDNLVIENGNFNFDTTDDAIHSNNHVGIINGNFQISTGDDAIHADNELVIDTIELKAIRCYEGLDAAKVIINNGNFFIDAYDDCINVYGGNDQENESSDEYKDIKINTVVIYNGNFEFISSGDCIDVNGSGYIYGGNFIMDGPNHRNDSTIDYYGEFLIEGGSLITGGSSGMLEKVASTKQYGLVVSFDKEYESNTKFSIVDEYGKEIITYISKKEIEAVTLSSPLLKKNKTYTIRLNDLDFKSFKTEEYITLLSDKIMKHENGLH